MRIPIENRFWTKVDVRGSKECWDWKASVGSTGYGQIGSGMPSPKPLKSHRVAYELFYGAIPEGMFVCHSCDNKLCCNPSHLFLGTNLDNVQDCVKKGRQARGEMKSRLTEEQVICIMARLLTGREEHKEIAAAFGVCRATISQIWSGKRWAHLFK